MALIKQASKYSGEDATLCCSKGSEQLWTGAIALFFFLFYDHIWNVVFQQVFLLKVSILF